MPNYLDDSEIIVPDNPDEDYLRTIYERGGLTDIPEEEKMLLARNTMGNAPPEIPMRVVDIDAKAEALRQQEEPTVEIPFQPRDVDESKFVPMIKGYGDRVILEKEPGQWVDQWGKPVTQEYADEIDTDIEALRLGGIAAGAVREKGNIPDKPSQDDLDEIEVMDFLKSIDTKLQGQADSIVNAAAERAFDTVDLALNTDSVKRYKGNLFPQVYSQERRRAESFIRGKKAEQKASAKAMQDAKAQAEKDAKKEAESIQKRQQKIEDDLRKGKITNLNNMEREARRDFKRLTKKGMTNLSEEEMKELSRIEQNIAEIVKKREGLYGGGQAGAAKPAKTKKLIGKKNGKPVYDLGNGKWQVGD